LNTLREREREREKERSKSQEGRRNEYILLRTGCFSQPHFKILVRRTRKTKNLKNNTNLVKEREGGQGENKTSKLREEQVSKLEEY
jgi:hypothetical protein